MSIISDIAERAITENKNILVIGSPRSGTHALGSMIAKINSFVYLGEIFTLDKTNSYLDNIKTLSDHNNISVSQLVQYSSKIKISNCVDTLKHNAIFVNIRRKNKLKQFASWVYFNRYHDLNKGWHSQVIHHSEDLINRFLITEQDIEMFLSEQMLDNFFNPDYILYYEDLTFENSMLKENVYTFDINTIFANLDFVKEQLENWKYPND